MGVLGDSDELESKRGECFLWWEPTVSKTTCLFSYKNGWFSRLVPYNFKRTRNPKSYTESPFSQILAVYSCGNWRRAWFLTWSGGPGWGLAWALLQQAEGHSAYLWTKSTEAEAEPTLHSTVLQPPGPREHFPFLVSSLKNRTKRRLSGPLRCRIPKPFISC
jgi:hypothetical protein